ncbi:MAG: hypothetical protein EB064_08115, partial [Betaproteobacteria bacterium]|nr:hypothetical protein [Betaproteobacteria bacterium]
MAIAFDDDNCNPTNNEHFQQVLDKSLANPARRRLIRGGFGLAALSVTGMLPTFAHANTASAPGKVSALGFESLDKSLADPVSYTHLTLPT